MESEGRKLPACQITDVSLETARLLPVCRIEDSSRGAGSNAIQPILKNGSSGSSTTKSGTSNKALNYYVPNGNYYLDAKYPEEQSSASSQSAGIDLSNLSDELLDFSGWLSGLPALKSQDYSSIYRDSGSTSEQDNKVRDLGAFIGSRLELDGERGFILVGAPKSNEVSNRLRKSNPEEVENQGEEDEACPSVPTKLTLFLQTPKSLKDLECSTSEQPKSSSTVSTPSSGGLQGLATKALSLRPDTSVTMSRDLGDGLKVKPSANEVQKEKEREQREKEAKVSSSTEAIFRALGIVPQSCPTLAQLQEQEQIQKSSPLVKVGGSSFKTSSSSSKISSHQSSTPVIPQFDDVSSINGDSFLELEFSISGARIRNRHQLGEAVLGAIGVGTEKRV